MLKTLIAISIFCINTSLSHADPVPNIVLMIADDCTYTDLGCYGGQAATPNLSRLCSEGVRFNRCFQAAPMCSPTRHCLYTGLYPVRSGAYPNHTFVDEGTKSVAHYLQAASYRTALSGKTHISPRSSFPFEYSADGPETTGSNPDFQAIEKLFVESKAAGTPFLAILTSNEPHTPYTEGDSSKYPTETLALPPHYVDTPETRQQFSKYLAEISYYDWQVGEMLSLLDKHDLVEDTLVIVLSEQGSSFPFAKWTCYEAGVQSGMVVRWPGRVPAGVESDSIVEYVDITPTLIEVAGRPAPAHIDGQPLDGRSFLPSLLDANIPHKDYTYSLQTTRGINNGSDRFAIRSVRDHQYRLIKNLHADQNFSNAVFTTGWWEEWSNAAAGGDKRAAKIVQAYQKRPAIELFDCSKDPWNLHNLAAEPAYSNVRKTLEKELARWMDQQGDLGDATEANANERQKRGRSKKKNRKAKP